MQQLVTLPRNDPGPKPVTNTLTVSVAADADATQRALHELDPFAPAIRAMRALGLTDRVTLTAGGMRWQPDGDGGHIDCHVEARVAGEPEQGSSLTIVTRFSATDERTHERLLDAWPILGPLAATVAERAARAVKHQAEADRFEEIETSEERAMAA